MQIKRTTSCKPETEMADRFLKDSVGQLGRIRGALICCHETTSTDTWAVNLKLGSSLIEKKLRLGYDQGEV